MGPTNFETQNRGVHCLLFRIHDRRDILSCPPIESLPPSRPFIRNYLKSFLVTGNLTKSKPPSNCPSLPTTPATPHEMPDAPRNRQILCLWIVKICVFVCPCTMLKKFGIFFRIGTELKAAPSLLLKPTNSGPGWITAFITGLVLIYTLYF